MHEWFVASDCSQNTIRILFVDFSKAFELIGHNILFDKFVSSDVPQHVVVQSMDLLNGHKHFVKTDNSVSNTVMVAIYTLCDWSVTLFTKSDCRTVRHYVTFIMMTIYLWNVLQKLLPAMHHL